MSSLPSQNFWNPAVVPENASSKRTPDVALINSVAAASVMGKTVLDPSTRMGTSDKALACEQPAAARQADITKSEDQC